MPVTVPVVTVMPMTVAVTVVVVMMTVMVMAMAMMVMTMTMVMMAMAVVVMAMEGMAMAAKVTHPTEMTAAAVHSATKVAAAAPRRGIIESNERGSGNRDGGDCGEEELLEHGLELPSL